MAIEDYGKSDLAGEAGRVKPDNELPGYRYARALAEQARGAAHRFTSTFKKNWDFLLGKDHFQMPVTGRAIMADEWQTKSVDNLLFAVVDDKASIIGKGELAIHVEDLSDQTTYWQRTLIAERLKQEAERLKWRRLRDDLFLQGSVTGVGVVMTTVKPDPLTGDMQIVSKVKPSGECLPDPEHDNIHDAGFFTWESVMPMAMVRAMFPSKADQVKADLQTVANQVSGMTDKTGSQGDDSLIYGGAQEFLIDSQSQLKCRKARVTFVWINDTESIVEELRNTILREATPGFQCETCSMYTYPEDAGEAMNCPHCGAPLVEALVPAKVQQDSVVQRQYPYGRLIVYSGDTLLFDGQNPLDIDGCYPFAVYHHYRVPGVFYGYGDVPLLWSNQIARDVTIGQGIDYIRLAVNAPFEYPVQAIAYGKLGNAPGQAYPVPNHLSGKAHYVTSDGFNIQAWQSVLSAIEKSFQVVSGRTDLVAGFVGNPPPSGVAVEATTQGYGGRVGAHARRMEDCLSDWLNQVYQLLHQHDSSARNVHVKMPNGSMDTVSVSMSELPKGVKLRISISTEEMLKDKIAGQNIAKVSEVRPDLFPEKDLMLALGVSPQRVKEIEDQKNLEKELAAQRPPPLPELPV